MTEEEALGIAENETPAAAPEAEETETANPAEGELTREEMLAACVRYEQALQPYMTEEEASESAMAKLNGEDAQAYLAEVQAWVEAGEPALDDEEGAPEATAQTEDEALGIAE